MFSFKTFCYDLFDNIKLLNKRGRSSVWLERPDLSGRSPIRVYDFSTKIITVFLFLINFGVVVQFG